MSRVDICDTGIQDPIVQECALYFPDLVKNATTYEYVTNHEIILTLDDGLKYCYDSFNKSIRKFARVDVTGMTIDEAAEAKWKKEFTDRLRIKMAYNKLTQAELANRSGLSQGQISRYIQGGALPSVHKIKFIADALGCAIADLIDF